MKENKFVLILNPGTLREKWPLGRVSRILCGTDGRVRVAKFQLVYKTLRKTITKFYPLEFSWLKIVLINKKKPHQGKGGSCEELHMFL